MEQTEQNHCYIQLHTITGSDFYDEFSSGLLKENAEKGFVVVFFFADGSF